GVSSRPTAPQGTARWALKGHENARVNMSTEVLYAHLVKQEGEPARLRRVPRVRVAQIVMDYLAYGWSAEAMCRHHPYLHPAQAPAAMAYYYDHAAEIDREIAEEIAEVERTRAQLPPSRFRPF